MLLFFQGVSHDLYFGLAQLACYHFNLQQHLIANIAARWNQRVVHIQCFGKLPAQFEFQRFSKIMAMQTVCKSAQIDQRARITQMQRPLTIG